MISGSGNTTRRLAVLQVAKSRGRGCVGGWRLLPSLLSAFVSSLPSSYLFTNSQILISQHRALAAGFLRLLLSPYPRLALFIAMSALTTASSSRQLVVSTVEVAKPTPTSTPPSHTSKLASSKTSERPSPGQWRHPKFDEIAQRKTASSFSQADMARIFWNTAALILAAIFYRKCFDLYVIYAHILF